MSNEFNYIATLKSSKQELEKHVCFSNPVTSGDCVNIGGVPYHVFSVTHYDGMLSKLDCDKMTPDLT